MIKQNLTFYSLHNNKTQNLMGSSKAMKKYNKSNLKMKNRKI